MITPKENTSHFEEYSKAGDKISLKKYNDVNKKKKIIKYIELYLGVPNLVILNSSFISSTILA